MPQAIARLRSEALGKVVILLAPKAVLGLGKAPGQEQVLERVPALGPAPVGIVPDPHQAAVLGRAAALEQALEAPVGMVPDRHHLVLALGPAVAPPG